MLKYEKSQNEKNLILLTNINKQTTTLTHNKQWNRSFYIFLLI